MNIIPPAPEWRPAELSRDEAAAILHALRANAKSPDAQRHEEIDWAFAALPDSPTVQRMKIASLIERGLYDDAEALLNRSLLQRPEDAGLMLSRAKCRLYQGRVREAESDIRIAIASRPHHAETLAISSRIAAEQTRYADAVSDAEAALQLKPNNRKYRLLLAEILTQSGAPNAAERLLQEIDAPPAVLVAQVFQRQGRLLDAAAALERDLTEHDGAESENEVRAALIDVLEAIGSLQPLRAAINDVDSSMYDAYERSAIALLGLGAFAQASRRAEQLLTERPLSHTTLHLHAIAAYAAGDVNSARLSLRLLRTTAHRVDVRFAASLWRRVLKANIIERQIDGKQSGADADESLLKPMLESTLKSIDSRLESIDESSKEADRFREHRAACLLALGRNVEAIVRHQYAEQQSIPSTSASIRTTESSRKAA